MGNAGPGGSNFAYRTASVVPCRPGKGEVGLPGSQLRIVTDGTAHPLTSKGSWGFQAGERLRIETPGGGGYGEPLA